MFYAPVRKTGDKFEVVIPEEEVERLNLVEGQMVWLQVQPKNIPSEELAQIVEEIREDSTPVMRYLKDK